MGTVPTFTHLTILNPRSHSKFLILDTTMYQDSISLLFHHFCPNFSFSTTIVLVVRLSSYFFVTIVISIGLPARSTILLHNIAVRRMCQKWKSTHVISWLKGHLKFSKSLQVKQEWFNIYTRSSTFWPYTPNSKYLFTQFGFIATLT